MVYQQRMNEFKNMLGKDGKAEVHVYFIHSLVTSFREYEAVNYMEYNFLADEVLDLKGIMSMKSDKQTDNHFQAMEDSDDEDDNEMLKYIQRNKRIFN